MLIVCDTASKNFQENLGYYLVGSGEVGENHHVNECGVVDHVGSM